MNNITPEEMKALMGLVDDLVDSESVDSKICDNLDAKIKQKKKSVKQLKELLKQTKLELKELKRFAEFRNRLAETEK